MAGKVKYQSMAELARELKIIRQTFLCSMYTKMDPITKALFQTVLIYGAILID